MSQSLVDSGALKLVIDVLKRNAERHGQPSMLEVAQELEKTAVVMSSRTCENCHFYGRLRKGIQDDDITALDKDYAESDPLVLCGLAEHFNTNLNYSHIPNGIPIVVDVHGYYAALRVPADFGCNKWQSKSP